MDNNEILRRLRFILSAEDTALIQCFQTGGCQLSPAHIQPFLAAQSDDEYTVCEDAHFIQFLEGLIIERRGPSPKPVSPPASIDNNGILKKIRIALTLEARDLDNIFMLADCEMSSHEISALYRKPSNKHFVPCDDGLLEKFFNGLSVYMRT
ncbi:DUF1456 family protein [Eionea flava]